MKSGKLAAIDLSASFLKPSTAAWLADGTVSLVKLHDNLEIGRWVQEIKPDILGLDSPLSVPSGLNGKFGSRQCERDLLRLGIPVLMTSLLAPLTFRALDLLKQEGLKATRIVEVYPHSLREKFNLLPGLKKTENYNRIWEETNPLIPFRVKDADIEDDHCLDAVLALWMVWLIREDQYQVVGDPTEGLLYLPK